jgi:hypothetical protein
MAQLLKLRSLLENLYFEPDHLLHVGAPEDLQRICAAIIAYVDTERVESWRTLHRQQRQNTKKE